MRTIRGGYLADIPKPWKRRFDDARRTRSVEILISMYYGIGRHWHFDLREEDNPIWDQATKSWRIAWDDKAGRGKRISGKRLDIVLSQMAAERMAKKHFPGRKLIKRYGKERWFQKEGE
jgi:hypothetical protein